MAQAGLISVNGEIQLPENAKISALDRGLLFGDNVFEVFVAFDDKILDLAPHLERLRASAEDLMMSLPWNDAELASELASLAQQLPCRKKYLRLVVTRGNGMGLSPDPEATPTKIIYAFPAKQEAEEVYQQGLALKRMIKPTHKRGAAAKTGNYLESVLAIQKAQKEGFDDVLWTNNEGEITEASTANIFFLAREGDQVHFVTPATHSGILKGITRATLIELLNNAKIPAREEVIFADQIPRFDEAFVCSTVRGLVPIKQIDRHRLHTARDSSVYRHVERLYLTWVQTEVGYRPDWRTGEPVETN